MRVKSPPDGAREFPRQARLARATDALEQMQPAHGEPRHESPHVPLGVIQLLLRLRIVCQPVPQILAEFVQPGHASLDFHLPLKARVLIHGRTSGKGRLGFGPLDELAHLALVFLERAAECLVVGLGRLLLPLDGLELGDGDGVVAQARFQLGVLPPQPR